MTAQELRSAGEYLYGRFWQTRLAEALGVDGSTVRRWVSGSVPVPNPAAAAINCFMSRRRDELARLAAMPDEEIDCSDIPETPEEWWKEAQLRRGPLNRPETPPTAQKGKPGGSRPGKI